MKFIKDFIQRYKNAKLAVKQLKNDEWKFNDSYDDAWKYKLIKGDIYIWIASGGWFCETMDCFHNELNHFGLFWRHYVWWFGVVPFIRRNKPKEEEDDSAPVLE